ncbi:MAG TPA: hypothetical protein VF306_21745 [Pirellulales bacterium]
MLNAMRQGDAEQQYSRCEPVVEPQAGKVLEVGGVVGDERQAVDQRHCRNHHVRFTNWRTAAQQHSPVLAVFFGACGVEVENNDVL